MCDKISKVYIHLHTIYKEKEMLTTEGQYLLMSLHSWQTGSAEELTNMSDYCLPAACQPCVPLGQTSLELLGRSVACLTFSTINQSIKQSVSQSTNQ